MVAVILIAAAIFAIAGVVLIGIATAITGIISTKKDPGTVKTRLLASSAISGFAAIFAIIAAIIGLLYGGRATAASFTGKGSSNSKKAKTLLIVFIVLIVIVLILYSAVIGLNIYLRNNSALSNDEKRSMTAGIILTGIGFISIAIGTVMIFLYGRSKIKR